MSRQSIATRSADPHLESELNAYNASFYDLGLRWHWDADTYLSLRAVEDPCERIRRYIEAQHPHLLHAYDAEFLTCAIESRKAGFQKTAADSTMGGAYFDWAQSRAAELGT